MTAPEQALDWFFKSWVHQYKVVATVEGGIAFQDARNSWEVVRCVSNANREQITQLQVSLKYHQAKHHEWLTAYQNSRCKSIGDYSRMFVRRPRMRRLVRFLISL